MLGFDVVFEARDVPGWGTTGDILFLAAGGYHHHLGFNTWKSAGGGPQPDGVAGLHHVALQLPDARRARRRGARACGRPTGRCARSPITARTWPIYISDPDGNDLELAWDRPFEEWPRDEAGHAAMAMDGEIDLDALIEESRSG